MEKYGENKEKMGYRDKGLLYSTVGIVNGGYLSLKIEGKEEVRSNF